MRSCILAVCLTLVGLAQPAVAQQANVTPDEVDKAIKKAVAYLYSQQHNNNWEVVPQRDPRAAQWDIRGWQWGGVTAVSTCALLAAGETTQDARIKGAVDWLAKADMYGIYGLGFRCQVWAMVPPQPEVRQAATRDRQVLLAAVRAQGDARGFYPYVNVNVPLEGEPNWYDHSVSQYGVLGMWACTQIGGEVPQEYWRVMEQAWKGHQMEDGGWSYRYRDPKSNRSKETVSMTAAGLATLFITQEMLHQTDGLSCNGNYKDVAIDRAMQWMAANFWTLKENQPYYSLYGVERVGVAGGYKYIGNVNWYQEGANFLVRTQRDNGSWGNIHPDNNPNCIPDTCFGLMFLSRGRAPVMMEKLQYQLEQAANAKTARPASWNQRPRDVANIARWVGKQMERDLNWQIVNLDAPVEELQDAPVLYISGKEALNLKPGDVSKLQRFVAYGGMIVGNADCNSKVFADSFIKLGERMFPGYTFRELPKDHPIFNDEQFKRPTWRQPPFLQGMSNGCRELMLLFPTDPGRGWQSRAFLGAERSLFAQAMANIFQYAVDKKNLSFKGQTYIVKADPAIPAGLKIPVARLEWKGNWDPEPAGWQRFSSILHNQARTDLEIEMVKLGDGRLLAGKFAVAHLTGTGKLELSADQRAELKKFVEGGGTLVIDAAGGNEEFAVSAEKELGQVFAGTKLAMLGADHAVFKIGEPITAFEYRHFARKRIGNAHGPRIKGMDFSGRTGVFFSAEDLSVALVGNPIDGITGYAPSTATAILSHIVAYAKK